MYKPSLPVKSSGSKLKTGSQIPYFVCTNVAIKLTLMVDNDDWEVVHCLEGVVYVKYLTCFLLGFLKLI